MTHISGAVEEQGYALCFFKKKSRKEGAVYDSGCEWQAQLGLTNQRSQSLIPSSFILK